MVSKRWFLAASLAVLQLGFLWPQRAEAQTIRATQESDGAIRVVVPGTFETTFTKKKGFGHTWFDLKHDPQKKRDIAPVRAEAGLLWTKFGIGDGKKVGTANPSKKMELLEAGPARVRVRLSGAMNRRGLGIPEEDLKEVAFEQTFTVYPTGAVYVDYVLLTEEPVPLSHFMLILKPNGAWGKSGKGEGAGEVRCAGEHGPAKPSGATASSFALEWTNGPTYFQDILLVMPKGKYNANYWDEGYLHEDLRAGLDIMTRWPDKKLPKGTDHIYLMMCFREDVNGTEAARPYANDYRSPDQLAVTKGEVDKSDSGDLDKDGFNEAEGCYVLKSGPKGASFTLHGAKAPRMHPAFKVKDWAGGAPSKIVVGGRELEGGKGFNASVAKEILLLQILEPVREDAVVTIARP